MAYFLLNYDILTKTRTYLSLKFNLDFSVNIREKYRSFNNYIFRNINFNLSKKFCGINNVCGVLMSIKLADLGNE